MDAKNEEIKKMEEIIATMNASIERERKMRYLAEMKNKMQVIRADTQKAIQAKNENVSRMKQVIISMEASIDQESKLGDEESHGSSELEIAIQEKINGLSRGIVAAQENTKKVVEQRNNEMKQLKAKINLLEKELTKRQENDQSAAILSTMRADLKAMAKVKDDAKKERDFMEKRLISKRKRQRSRDNKKNVAHMSHKDDSSVRSGASLLSWVSDRSNKAKQQLSNLQ
jgi:hypothetical protein